MESILRHAFTKIKNQALYLIDRSFKLGPAVAFSPAQKLFLKKYCVSCLLIIGAIFLTGRIRDAHTAKSTAYLAAQGFVAEHLVRPSSAKFPPRSAGGIEVDNLGRQRYCVSGYLFSLNTFGNFQRSSYTCIVRYVGNGEWVQEKTTFE